MTDIDEAGTLEQITRRRERWIAAINAGDADGFVAGLADDAVWLPTGQPAIESKARIRAWLLAPFAELSYDYSVSDVRVRLAGEWAVEHARFTTCAQRHDGTAMPVHEGAYTILWHHTDAGGWLIDRYIDHSGGDAA